MDDQTLTVQVYPKAMPDEHGFTLLEILVVLVIIGLTLALVQVNFSPSENRLVNDEFTRLQTVLALAQEDVSAQGRSLAFEPLDQGYRFLRKQNDVWEEERDAPLNPHVFPPGVRWGALNLNGQPRSDDNARIVWQPGVPPATAELPIASEKHARTLLLDPLGRILDEEASQAH